MRLGFHLPIRGGFSSVPSLARSAGCECLQIFSQNPRGWAGHPIDPAEAALFRREARAAGLTPLVIHAAYLINLCASDKDLLRRSRRMLNGELKRAGLLSIDFVVVHMGSRGTQPLNTAITIMAESVDRALSRIPPGVTLLLENTAGAGGQVGHTFEEMAVITALLEDQTGWGLCLDTAHLCAAGYDLSSPEGVKLALDECDRLIGLDHVKLIHLNDSRLPVGSRRDRHTHIGRGYIGKRGMRSLLREPRLRELAAIMETPKEDDTDDVMNMRLARRLRDGWIRAVLSQRLK